MRCGSLFAVLVVLAGCPGGDGSIGDHCSDRGDCASSLQCVASACVPLCHRAPDCGDGYSCDKDGVCHAASGQLGDSCTSEVDCAAGLACELEGSATDASMHLLAACSAENPGSPAGSVCVTDTDCRNGTCALGHCVDLCSNTLDCTEGTSCTLIPRVEADGKDFAGCLQSDGVLRWSLPIHGPSDTVPLPIPNSARGVTVTFSVEDPDQMVGATSITAPNHEVPFTWNPTNPDAYYANNEIRHKLEFAQSVLAMPSTPDYPLQSGMYTLKVESQRLGGVAGTATPNATAVIKLDSSVILDLHFYFLNFDEHPCSDSFNGKLDASAASTQSFFQSDFLGMLRSVLTGDGGVALGTITYEDLRNHPELDGLDVANAPALLALGAHDDGVNVFFVRSLSPVGLQAYAPTPGPASIAGTRGSGVVIGLDTLCYRSWQDVARLTAHEVARYMGLYDVVEIDDTAASPKRDPIAEDHVSGIDPAANLMFYSELGGTTLTDQQRDILSRSPVLR